MQLEGPFLKALSASLGKKSCPVLEEVPSGSKALVCLGLLKELDTAILYISAEGSSKILDDAPFFGITPLELPDLSEVDPNPDLKAIELKTLLELKKDPKRLVVGSIHALVRTFVAADSLKEKALNLEVGKTLPFKEFETKLIELGYRGVSIVQEKGTFARRGGIYDLFPPESFLPIRIEFDEDEIVSLREFDPVLQTSVKKIKKLSLMGFGSTVRKESIFEYLPKNAVVIFDGIEGLEEQWTYSQRLESKNLSIPTQNCCFFAERPLSELFAQHEDTQNYLGLGLKFKKLAHPFLPSSAFFMTPSQPTLEELALELDPFLKDGGKASMTYATEAERHRLEKFNLPLELKPGYLSSGFYLVSEKILFLSYQDFSVKRSIRRAPLHFTQVSPGHDFEALHPGDVIVHASSGIGKFLGVEKRLNHLGQESEYFKLEFAEKSVLYVPLKEASLITRYVGTSQEIPSFSQLGSTRWQKIRAQTHASILGYAQQLLELAAKRQLEPGFSFKEDSDLQKEFEEDFPFMATDDQIRAIAEIKIDMQKPTPMDRLVCGDVGYGKTEVAMRAAFKAVVDGNKQVAVLVPTTVLALQHFENFKERMSNFPIRIGVISRFSSPKEVKSVIQKTKQGELDIVIGTHRLLSPDIQFKDLGLLVIDEEQRFGVKAKEGLKKLKATVDCLTLSATPIPRTLYSSIVGLRQMSVISTPPYDRLPIRTVLTVKEDGVIRQALLKELARKGQAYFIHNRVENLPLIHKKLNELVPEAKIGIAHGQMESEAIDTVFHAFKKGDLDILIATTLVENGVDIPNANTILIDNAQNFGISDLYQLRGRVGRWNKAALCYLLVPKNLNLDESSRKRLEAIVSTSGYGGGLKVAMRDLEIRGAGDLIGTEQSGHVSQIGFNLYCKLLKKTLLAMQKQMPLNPVETKIDWNKEARIPESYISDVDIRIEFYHRFGEASTLDENEAIYKELIDRFGQAPEPVMWLYALANLRVFGQLNSILVLSIQTLTVSFEKSRKGKVERKTLKAPKATNPLAFEKALREAILEML